jgi:hypothetical protein
MTWLGQSNRAPSQSAFRCNGQKRADGYAYTLEADNGLAMAVRDSNVKHKSTCQLGANTTI